MSYAFVQPTSSSFHPSQRPNVVNGPSFEGRIPINKRNVPRIRSSSSSGPSTDLGDETSMIGPAVAVGVTTAGIGFLYGKALNAAVHVLWQMLPRLLSKTYGSINPMAFFAAVCGFGGLLWEF